MASITLIKFKREGVKVLLLLMGIISLIGTLILMFLPKVGTEILKKEKKSKKENFLTTFKLFVNKKMLLLAPLVFFVGMEEGFIFGSFPANIASKIVEREYIGFYFYFYFLLSFLFYFLILFFYFFIVFFTLF